MTNKNNKVLTLVAIITLLLMVVGATYAYFAAQAGGTTSTDATVTSNTTDLLTFSINRDISFTVTQALFAQNGQNQSGDATATATLTPNNKTGAATMNYYMYLNLQNNPTVYSEANTNEDPELMLQVFDGNNQLVTLTGLGTQKTIKGVTGYDITGVSGIKTLLDNHAISATNNTATIENWRIVITLINLDVNQNDNTGKEISAEIIIQKEEMDLGFTGTIYVNPLLIDQPYGNHSMIGVHYLNGGDIDGVHYYGISPYTTDVDEVRSVALNYLKIDVVSNIMESAETCLYYNNRELCLEPGYWEIVETELKWCILNLNDENNLECFNDENSCLQLKNSQYNGSNYTCREMIPKASSANAIATTNKLQADMETAFDVSIECSNYDYSSSCYLPNYVADFTIFSSGAIATSEDYECYLGTDGEISCTFIT